MIGPEDALYTYEYKDYYKILPVINNWSSSKNRIKNGKKVAKGERVSIIDFVKDALNVDSTINSTEKDSINAQWENNSKQNFDPKYNIFKYPIDIYNLIEKINIQLIKQKYDFQSKIKLKNYSLDLNSRTITKNSKNLKLTEREMDIILFLNDSKKPQKINILQNQVWKYLSKLETHTVETHIYRLRKKMNDNFKDDNFIISSDAGYFIK